MECSPCRPCKLPHKAAAWLNALTLAKPRLLLSMHCSIFTQQHSITAAYIYIYITPSLYCDSASSQPSRRSPRRHGGSLTDQAATGPRLSVAVAGQPQQHLRAGKDSPGSEHGLRRGLPRLSQKPGTIGSVRRAGLTGRGSTGRRPERPPRAAGSGRAGTQRPRRSLQATGPVYLSS
jgi:hypothetical protein